MLSREEVARFLEAASGVKYKAAFSAAYGAGLRVSEVAALKVSDIDSERMLLRIEQGRELVPKVVMLRAAAFMPAPDHSPAPASRRCDGPQSGRYALVFTPGDHGSTFGGNPIAAAVGLAALDTLIDERLIERTSAVGAHLLSRLASIKSPIIREVRGRGRFAGVDRTRQG